MRPVAFAAVLFALGATAPARAVSETAEGFATAMQGCWNRVSWSAEIEAQRADPAYSISSQLCLTGGVEGVLTALDCGGVNNLVECNPTEGRYAFRDDKFWRDFASAGVDKCDVFLDLNKSVTLQNCEWVEAPASAPVIADVVYERAIQTSAADANPIDAAELLGCWTRDPTEAELADWSKRKVVTPGGYEALVLATDPSTGQQLLEMVPSEHLCFEKERRFSATSFAGDEGLGSSGDYRLENRQVLFATEWVDGWLFGRERVLCELRLDGNAMTLANCLGADEGSTPNPREPEHFDDLAFTRDIAND